MNSVFNSLKVVAIFTLLSGFNGFAMETSEPVIPETSKTSSIANKIRNIWNAGKTPEALASVEAPVETVITPEAQTLPVVSVEPTASEKTSVVAKIRNAWNAGQTSVTKQSKAIFAAAKDMKVRGWSKWSTNEKVGAVIGGAAVVGIVAYVSYKLYKSLTNPKKKLVARVRSNRV